MKKGLFRGLFFREFYIAKKNLIINLIAYAFLAFFSILILLSLEHGNLALLLELGEINLADEAKPVLNGICKFLPVYASACFFGASADATPRDETQLWRNFRRSAPVSGFRFALAKFSFLCICLLISFVLAFGYLGIICGVSGTTITIEDVSITMAIYCIGVLLILYLQFVTILFGSMEKAFIAVLVPVLLIAIISAVAGIHSITIQMDINAFCITLLPFTPVIIAMILLLGFMATSMLYKRREK